MKALLLLAILFVGLYRASLAQGFVTADGPRLLLDGQEYRAIGVNLPHLHTAYNGTWHHNAEKYGTPEKARQAVIDAILDAERSKVAFIRFFANPGYPIDIDKLFTRDNEEYWQQFDEVVELCRAHNLKLVPSLNMMSTWHWYFNEPRQALLDPGSKTYKASYDYIRQLVTRYKDDPIILMWELANEAMLGCDVDTEGQPGMSAGLYSPGAEARTVQTREDSFTWDLLLRVYKEQTTFIKELDPNHLVTSGDASVRAECTSRRETFPNFKYRSDTYREWIANNLASQPEPLEVASYHIYGGPSDTTSWDGAFKLPPLEFYKGLIRATHAARVPVFIGEFGQHNPSFLEDPEASFTRALIDLFEQEEVSLSALWVWHFNWQPDLTVSSATHPLLTERIAEFNRKYAGLE